MSMLLAVETLDALQKLGLSTYEAKAYMALAASGPTTATVLVAESEVPRTRIYGVLKRLEEKKWIAESRISSGIQAYFIHMSTEHN